MPRIIPIAVLAALLGIATDAGAHGFAPGPGFSGARPHFNSGFGPSLGHGFGHGFNQDFDRGRSVIIIDGGSGFHRPFSGFERRVIIPEGSRFRPFPDRLHRGDRRVIVVPEGSRFGRFGRLRDWDDD